MAIVTIDIMAKELAPNGAVWVAEFAKHSVCIQCDNSSIVAAIKKGSAKDNVVAMHLLTQRCL